jgi:hypothetical protein
MKLTNQEWLRAGRRLGLWLTLVCLMGAGLGSAVQAQAVSTTTVQGTVYLANGQPGSGTLVVSWPTFTTASGQLVVADSATMAISPNGSVSVNLAPNVGATPAGEYYTAVFYMSDGTTNSQYWVVPVAAQATLAQVQAQVMPAAQAVQAVSPGYVNQAIAELSGSMLTASGGTLTGPLYLSGDPTQPLQAADKHYVDDSFAQAVPLTGGTLTGPLTSVKLGALYQVDQFPGTDFGAKLGACLSGLSSTNGGTCDARNFSGTQSMGSNLTISTANATVLLPCATISTTNQVIVTAGTRNVSLRGCALRGASTASGSQGGTVLLYSGAGAMVQVGDPAYAADTMGFHLDNVAINTTASTSATAQGLVAYRTQELDLESLYFLGNSNQTGMTLDGTGNYTGGTFLDNEFSGFQTAVNAIGHQIANPATTDWMNASTFVRLHIDCPTNGGSPVSGTYGINFQQGDGNTFSGGDVEGCSTALHLGANAQNNTIVGLRNENSTNQVVADAGSSYNSWMTGGTMFTGALTDNGTRNSFLDTFHRSFNGLNGDWYGSQKDATVTNHYRFGIGAGNERGLLNEIQTDYGYRWLEGYSDATAGEQFYQLQDLLNSVYRISVGQYNNGQSSTNNQTVINAAGTGAVVLNGSNNAGTGGVVIGSGGANETTVATINNTGNAQFNGTLQVGGTTTLAGTPTVKNQADAEIDAALWAGLTTSQKESFIYKDWNGASQWYMVKDASNNWALNSATSGLDSFKAYQGANSGDTYINAQVPTGTVRINYETGAGAAFNIYGGSSSSLYASFTGAAAIKFPGLAASSGHNCVQIDTSGYITNTGSACGTGSASGTVNDGTSGQIAYYNGSGTALSGTNTVPVTAGGTGASTASGALTNLGGAALAGAAFTGPVSIASTLSAQNITSIGPRYDVTQFGAKGDGSTDDTAAIQAAFNACWNNSQAPTSGVIEFPGPHTYVISSTINAYDGCQIKGVMGNSSGSGQPRLSWNGPAAGSVSTITGFTITANSSPYVFAPSSPAVTRGSFFINYQPWIITFTATNSLTAGQWVDIEGLSTAEGLGINRLIAQVASATSSSFVVVTAYAPAAGSFTDSGTATTVNVAVAFDADARFEESVSNMTILNQSGLNASSNLSVGLYFGSRVDTGTHVLNTQVAGATKYSYYFADGGINVDFDKGWRSDGAGLAGIYWRVAGEDNLGIANGTADNTNTVLPSSGGMAVFDNAGCAGSYISFTSRNVTIEIHTTITPGFGIFTMFDCPTAAGASALGFALDMEQTRAGGQYFTTAGFNFPSFVMSPQNDAALELTLVNSVFPNGVSPNTTARWVGLPELLRKDNAGQGGQFPLLSYSPSYSSQGGGPGGLAAPTQLMGDSNIGQLWQDGIRASALLYSDTAYAALPNGTTLYAGQILAPPAYWNSGNSANKRFALDVVYQTGTTGALNSGNTTCTGTSGAAVLTCSSATDLSAGQRVTIGTDTNKAINYINATNPSAVLVNLAQVLGSTYSTAAALSFSAPVLEREIQMPTKSSAAPTALAWSQGDMEQNFGAAANGIAAWVNVAAGTPGTWAAIPLGDSNGQLSEAQIQRSSEQGTDTMLLTAGTVSGTGSPLCTDANGGATTSGCPSAKVVTNTPLWLQYLGTGADGSYEASPTNTCSTSPSTCAANCTASTPCNLGSLAEKYYTSFQVDSGAYVYEAGTQYNNGLVIHSTGVCNVYGTMLLNGAKSTISGAGMGGSIGGGSGGGTSAGTVGNRSYLTVAFGGNSTSGAASAGTASGGNGGNGNLPWNAAQQRAFTNGGAGGLDGFYLTGSSGPAGANSGGAGGYPGEGLVMMCGSIDGTGGTVDLSGGYGNPPTANSEGAGAGAGAGAAILSSQAAVNTWPTIYAAGGPGGLVTVPYAAATGGSCTSPPKATLGVTSGALSGTCTVVQAGAGCGTGAGINWVILGGGGTQGTATVNPTFTSGALTSCTVTPGTSSGYTAATYTTAGTGGDGGVGWYSEFSGW